MQIIYLRSHKRRPVRPYPSIFSEDVQGAIPCGWCEGCGMECYTADARLCPECLRKETDHEASQ